MRTVGLYPLRFTPLLKHVVWGGHRLAQLGKRSAPGERIGESWELVDLPGEQSEVANGPLAGTPLHHLVTEHAPELLGPTPLARGRFPLLVKYIDARETLSVQVHPDESTADRLGGRPKSEAWCILDADENALIYLGLRNGVTKAELERGITEDNVSGLLQTFKPRAGDFIPVPPGTLHAIGGGVLLAEVQQPSETTYRVSDWGRVDFDGRPRPLHVAEALACTRLDSRPRPCEANVYDAGCFRAERVHLTADESWLSSTEGPLVVVGLAGQGELASAETQDPIGLGQVTLVPHNALPVRLSTASTLAALAVTFPTQQSL